MTEEDEEFERIEREVKQRLEAAKETIRYRDAFPKDYALPKPWVGLTDEEIQAIEETTECLANESWLRNLTRNLEAKLREKNA